MKICFFRLSKKIQFLLCFFLIKYTWNWYVRFSICGVDKEVTLIIISAYHHCILAMEKFNLLSLSDVENSRTQQRKNTSIFTFVLLWLTWTPWKWIKCSNNWVFFSSNKNASIQLITPFIKICSLSTFVKKGLKQ